MNYNEIEDTVPKTVIAPSYSLPSVQAHSAVHQYLERQGRNEYINLASQIAYNGNNIAFVFYENQIRKLMDESPLEERRLKVLRASCVGQPREIVNLFFAPLKGMLQGKGLKRLWNSCARDMASLEASRPSQKSLRSVLTQRLCTPQCP